MLIKIKIDNNILYCKSGIKIKKSHKGLFTKYCGGNVTSACIAKAKRSGNPTLVKRATFAANARKWKHLQGGIINNVNKMNLRFYKHFSPYLPYTDDNIRRAIDLFRKGPEYAKLQYLKRNKGNKLSKKLYYTGAEGAFDDAVWGTYLNIPMQYRKYKSKLSKSKYAPTKGRENTTYYKIPILPETKETLVREGQLLQLNKNSNTKALFGYNMGTSTVGRGYDKKGEYISYYDKWDVNPMHGDYADNSLKGTILGYLIPKNGTDMFMGKTTPLSFYDRIYLDDYYGVKEPTHSTYLPEVTVTKWKSNKKKKGGKLCLIPRN